MSLPEETALAVFERFGECVAAVNRIELSLFAELRQHGADSAAYAVGALVLRQMLREAWSMLIESIVRDADIPPEFVAESDEHSRAHARRLLTVINLNG